MYGSKRIWIGNTASPIPLNKRLHPDLSHEWTVYVRASDSSFITSVVFKLHESFPNNIIETKYPFEHTEHGWGEFTVGIKICTTMGTVNTSHILKIHNVDRVERMEEIGFKGVGDIYEISKDEEEEYNAIERAIDDISLRLQQHR